CADATLYTLAAVNWRWLTTQCPVGTMATATGGWVWGSFTNYRGYVYNWYNGDWNWGWFDGYNAGGRQYHYLNGTWVDMGSSGGQTWNGYILAPCNGGRAQGYASSSYAYYTGTGSSCTRRTAYAPAGKEFGLDDPCQGSCY